jgi:hypothetical protein
MGSDDGGKTTSHFSLYLSRWRLLEDRHKWMLAAALQVLLLVVFIIMIVLPPPELYHTETFSLDDLLDPQRIPHFPLEQCAATVHSFAHCQQQSVPSTHHVLACHRKWCHNSWMGGHCEPCGGLGDRTRVLLSRVHEFLHACHSGRVLQLDYPLRDVAVLESVIYHDPLGWWGEFLHQRSYNVADRKVHVQPHSHNPHILSTEVLHFLAQPYQPKDYNFCLFHILFQPGQKLQQDLDHYNQLLNQNNNLPSSTKEEQEEGGPKTIGIHYHTGYAATFGMENQDHVVPDATGESWRTMQQCAKELAAQLFPTTPLDHVSFFLATDNPHVKAMVQKQQQQELVASSDDDRLRIITTHGLLPDSYLRGVAGDDRDAWMELYLLAARQGLVVNVRPHKDHAERLSQFALLAKKVGFIKTYQVQECVLD